MLRVESIMHLERFTDFAYGCRAKIRYASLIALLSKRPCIAKRETISPKALSVKVARLTFTRSPEQSP